MYDYIFKTTRQILIWFFLTNRVFQVEGIAEKPFSARTLDVLLSLKLTVLNK
jgi:hypothetical protein